jgi:hypothetical protein
MIRRDAGDDWLLISQVEHARIAAEVAEAWGNDQVAPLPSRELLIHAIRHHDDGWAEWEAAPTVNPETGEPRDFLEMPLADAAAIWTRSINLCACRSPWCGLWVSRHFCHLAESAREHRRDRIDREAASVFLTAQQELQSRWRERVGSAADRAVSGALERAGYEWLRWFDGFSLWLCCAERSRPETLPLPGGAAVSLTPRDAHHVTLEPSPFRGDSLQLTVSALRLGRQQFSSEHELQSALNSRAHGELSWLLQPP